MEINNSNINKFLLICLFVAGLTLFIYGLYTYKQFIYCKSAINEYNKIKKDSYKRLQIYLN